MLKGTEKTLIKISISYPLLSANYLIIFATNYINFIPIYKQTNKTEMRRTLLIGLFFIAFYNAIGQNKMREHAIETESPINIASEEIRKSFTPPPASFNLLKSATEKKAEINVVFVDFPEEAKTAFLYATSIWESVISSPVPINILAKWETIDGNVLAKSRPALNFINFEGALVPDVYFPVTLVEKLSGVEMNDGEPDIICSFNKNMAWYFGTDGNVPTTKYDFTTSVLHEITHGLGFSGFLKAQNSVGFFNNSYSLPSIFDYTVYNNSYQRLADKSIFTSPSNELKNQLTSDNLISYCPKYSNDCEIINTNIYAPTTWSDGSSIYHLNESDYGADDDNGLMTPYLFKGEAIHTPGEKTLEILAKLGWKTISFNFEKLKDIENSSTNFPININVASDLPLDSSSVKIVFSTTQFSTKDSVILTFDKETNLFSGSIPLKNYLGKVLYFFKASSSEDQVFTLPSRAPAKVFSLRIGPDYYPPTLRHNPEKIVLKSSSDVNVAAFADDNVGINSVKVEYKINGIMQEPLVLTNDSADYFNGKIRFPVQLTHNTTLEYRIIAEDKSVRKNKKSAPATGFYSVNVFEPQEPVSGYFSDFNSESTDFVSTDFTTSVQPGFYNAMLHTQHPYPVSAIDDKKNNLIAQLKYPVILEENGQMIFDEIVLVEPGEPGTQFTDQLFWDYVIVEGSKNNGVNWLPLTQGYDSREQDTWSSTFSNALINNTSTADGRENMFVKHTINLTQNTNFSAGDTVLFRFRLASDKSINGWGWAIDNLDIQNLSTANDDLPAKNIFNVYPNPFTNNFFIDCANLADKSDVDIVVTDLMGKTVFSKTWADTQFNPKEQIDLSYAKPGIYLVKIIDSASNMITKKIIKN